MKIEEFKIAATEYRIAANLVSLTRIVRELYAVMSPEEELELIDSLGPQDECIDRTVFGCRIVVFPYAKKTSFVPINEVR